MLTNHKIHIKLCFFVFLLILTVIGTIGGCNDGSGGNNDQALTENDFVNDDSLSANPEGGVIVTFLEHETFVPEVPVNDTGEFGIDEIPLTYKRTLEHTFCWEDEDEEARHFMLLLDSEGIEILRVDVNSGCVTEVIEKGNYVMVIYHDGRTETTHPIFMIPNPEELEQARKTDGLINRLKVVGVSILKEIQKTVTKDAEAQTVEDNIQTLLSTNNCQLCDLSGAKLSGAKLGGAKLSAADLRDAILIAADLSGAKLGGADLSAADLSFAKLGGADLLSAILRDAILIDADLSGAKLIDADLSGADFSAADLSFAKLGGADLSGADLSFATWCNGCKCTDSSIGTCNGCPSVEEVCTGF